MIFRRKEGLEERVFRFLLLASAERARISDISADEAHEVVRRAFELGINYFDTAKLDGDSEEKNSQNAADPNQNARINYHSTYYKEWR